MLALRRSYRAPFTTALVAGLLATAGCHSAGQGHTGGADMGGANGLSTITVTPAAVTLTISGTTPVTQLYTATGTTAAGATMDVTDLVTWGVSDTSIGTFTGAQFTSGIDHGGAVTVSATLGGATGSGTLTIILSQRYNDPGSPNLPANPGMAFGGTPSTTDLVVPRLVYPNDQVLLPPNLGELEIHFTPGGDGSAASPNTLFELSFTNAVTDVKVYLRCPVPPPYTDAAATPAKLSVNFGCVYTTDAKLWTWIAQTNRGRDPLTISVRGTTDSGGAVGSSASLSVSFSIDDIEGAIYYWEIGPDQPCVQGLDGKSSGAGCSTTDATAIVRYDFAGTDPTGTTFLTPNTPGSTGGTCLGCHALSHDGTALVAEAGGQGDGRALLWDVAKNMPTVPFSTADRTLFESWNPDGSQYVGVNNFPDDAADNGNAGGTACTGNGGNCDLNLRLYDGVTSKFVADVPGTSINDLPADHPDWSLDGNSIAYDLVGKANGAYPTTLQQSWNGTVYVVTKNGSGGWNAPVAVATPPDDHTNYYYPAFSPDSSLLVFDRAVCPPGSNLDGTCDFDTASTSRLFAALPTANAMLIELANANKPGPLDASADVTNSYPKWSPFIFRKSDEFGSKLMWLTFASKRHFGLRAEPWVLNRGAPGEVLWMTGFDPTKVSQGTDPSFVPFALPFQRFYKSNHIAQWTSKIVPPIS